MDVVTTPAAAPFLADVFFSGGMIAAVALLVAALASLYINRERVTSGALVAWALLIVLIPLFGSLAWVIFGLIPIRRSQRNSA